MKDINQIATRNMRSLRARNPRAKVQVLQSSLERRTHKGAEVITFQNTKGDWFRISISNIPNPKEG